jgi:3-hydroxyisobutyrate dehydrogenase
MARNLQAKLSPSDTLRLFDINKDAMEKLAQEMMASKAGGAAVQLADTAVDAARETVCTALLSASPSSRLYDEFVLSMI